MKIWFGYGSEHSANLVVIGKFESAAKAQEAMKLFDTMEQLAQSEERAGRLQAGKPLTTFSDQVLDMIKATNFAMLDYNDPEKFLYDHSARVEGASVVITTDEIEVMPFLKVLISKGAKVEVYSAHDHAGPYGRPTKVA